MKKFVLFTDSMSKSGGIERVTANLANMWSDLGYCVEIVVLEDEITSFFPLKNTVKIHSLHLPGYKSKYEMPLWYASMTIRFRKYIKKSRPDIVFGIWTSRATSAILAAAFLGIPVVACEHIAFTELRKGLHILRKMLYPHANAIVALTEADTQRYKLMNKNSFTIVNAVEPVDIVSPTFEMKTILAVGRLVPQKGFDLLLEAWSLIFEKYPDWNLKIIGRSLPGYEAYARNLRTFAQQVNFKESVIFQDQTKRIIEEYDKAAFFVLSSRFEGLPMVLLEAMSRSMPVISFDCPTGPREIITDGKNGLLVENGNVKALASAMEKFICEEDYRSTLGEQANLEIVKKYSTSYVKCLWEELSLFLIGE